MRGSHATDFATIEGPRILIRPDGYIAHIGEERFREYAGVPTRAIEGLVSVTNRYMAFPGEKTSS